MGADAPERARGQLQSLLEKVLREKAEAICRYEEQLTNKRQPRVDAATWPFFRAQTLIAEPDGSETARWIAPWTVWPLTTDNSVDISHNPSAR
jgi:hypothetical protein